jgi:hypothetical protein
VTVTVACGVAEPFWVVHAQVITVMAARTAGAAARRNLRDERALSLLVMVSFAVSGSKLRRTES